MAGAVERGRARCLLEVAMSDLKHSITLEPGDTFGVQVGCKVAKCMVNAVAVGGDVPKPPGVNQRNPQWADDPLTPETDSTIGDVGCLACSIYSLALLWGYDKDLGTFLGTLYDAGAFSGAYLSNPAAAADAIDVLRWEVVMVKGTQHRQFKDWSWVPAPVDFLSDVLDLQPVVVQVDYDPQDRDIDTHFVVAYQYVPPSLPGGIDDDLLIMDPVGGRYASVLEYFDPDWLRDGSMPEGVTKVARTVTGARIWTTGLVESEPESELSPEPFWGGSTVSFHVQRGVDNLMRFVRNVRPSVIKLTHCSGLAGQIHDASPDTFIVYRKVYNDWQRFIYGYSNLNRAARDFLDWVSPEIQEIQCSIGDTVFGVEGLNETIACGAVEDIERAVKFERYFALRLRDAYANAVPVSPNIAVGNPQHGSEERMLCPLHATLAEVGGFASYHAYWPANERRSWLESDWEHYAGRWVAHDRACGVKVHWILTEGGPVGGPSLPYALSADAGWRHLLCLNRDWNRLVDEVLRFDQLAHQSVPGQEGRYHGLALFTVGGGSRWCWWNYHPNNLLRMEQTLTE